MHTRSAVKQHDHLGVRQETMPNVIIPRVQLVLIVSSAFADICALFTAYRDEQKA